MIKQQKMSTKYLVIIFISLILGLGVYAFYLHEDYLLHFKLYYVKSHFWATKYRLINNYKTRASKNEKTAKSIPILVYHGIINRPDGKNVVLDQFQDHLAMLKKMGYQTIGIEDLRQFLKGEKNLPERSFVLTFDDGRRDSFYPVDPLLKVFNYKAVVFLITRYNLDEESSFYLSKNEITDAIKSGRWEFQPHAFKGHDSYLINDFGGKGHFYTNKLWLGDKERLETTDEFSQRIKTDLEIAKKEIEDNLKVKADTFALPYGDYGQESLNFPESKDIILNNAKGIYESIYYQKWLGQGFFANYLEDDHSMINRISVSPKWNGNDLLQKMESILAKDLPYEESFANNHWVSPWGKAFFNNKSLVLEPAKDSDGGVMFLEGSRLWKNYTFETMLDQEKISSISLLAYYQNDSNYIACTFADSLLQTTLRNKGEEKVIQKQEGDEIMFPKKNLKIGISVSDKEVNCLLDGKSIQKTEINDLPWNKGGIGIKIWEKIRDGNQIMINELKVRENE